MRKSVLFTFILFLFFSCSHKKQIIYLSDLNDNLNKINKTYKNEIGIGDVLKIDVATAIPEASIPYNDLKNNLPSNSLELLVIDGYLVDENHNINYPILGEISVSGTTELELSKKIENMLVKGGHLTNPFVKVKKVNSKFTILGEVKNPGTFKFYDSQLNIFQALGYAGDLLISAKRKKIILIREENGLRKSYTFSLTKSDLLGKPYYFVKNNDVIIIEPNFSKIKSTGFIGSPSSIASISSLILSITLLIINN